MNILIFSWRGPGHPLAGGAEQVTHEHAKTWVKAGHNVTLFTSMTAGQKAFEKLDTITIIRAGDQVLGVRVAAFIWYLFGKHNHFDIVFDHFHGIPFFTPLFVRAKKIAFIHEVGKEVWALNPWPKPFNLVPSIVGRLLEPFLFRLLYKGTPFLTVSESTRDDLIAWEIPKDNISVVHNGFSPPNRTHTNTLKKQKVVMYLGAIAKDKGIEDALETFSYLTKVDAKWQFWVVGKMDKSYGEHLHDRCSALGIQNKIKFLGYVTDTKKYELLSKAQVLVNPSVREGWGLVNIEASAVGTPVVAYKVPGIVDSVKDTINGVVVNKRQGPQGLAQAILHITKNPNKYKQLSASALQWSYNFSWDKAGASSLALIRSITRLNILLLSWRGPSDPSAGGAEYVAHEHAKAWVKNGNKVTLFTSRFASAISEEVLDGVTIVRNGNVLLGVHIKAFFWYFFGKHDHFDLVIDHFHGIPFFTPLYVRVKKLAVIHEVAREIWLVNQIRFPLNLIIGVIGYISEPIIFKLFYRNIPFLTGSNSTKEELVSLGIKEANISVIHHAISTEEHALIRNKEKVVTFLGSLAKDKGIEDAIKVFSRLNSTNQGWKFWVIGKGDPVYTTYLNTMVVNMGLENKITFWGFVSNDERNKLLSKSFVLINPSIKEGWGLVNIEANAFGTPVVGYNVAGTRDSVIEGKTGMLSKAGDYNGLVDSIISLSAKPKVYTHLQDEGIAWSNKFRWSKLTEESSSLIETIVRS